MKDEKTLRQEITKEISKTLAHDLRSPLLALDVAAKTSIDVSPELHELIKTAAVRIREIVDELAKN